VDDTIANIEEDIRRLAEAGARTFLIPNDTYIEAASPAEQTFRQLHEQAIDAELGGFAQELGIEIVVADFATGIDLLIATPERFGLTNVTDPCLASAAPPLPASLAPGDVCSNPDQFLFWDTEHLTSTAHQFLAEYAADTLMAPTTIGAETGIATLAGDDFLRRMDEALRQSRPGTAMLPAEGAADRPYDVFLSGQATQGSGEFEGSVLGFDYSIASLTGRIMFHPSEAVSLGLVGGYDWADADLDGSAGSVDLTSWRIGAVAGYDGGQLFGSAGLAYGFDDYDLFRQTYVPELTSSADTQGGTIGAFGTAGYRFELGRASFGPLLGLRYTRVHVDAYDESGAPGLDMHVDAQTADALIGSAGLAAAARLTAGGATITPYVELALEGDLLGGAETLTTALVTVPDVDRHLTIEPVEGAYGRLSGGVSVEFRPALGIAVMGETTLGRDGGDEYSLIGRLAARF
jgi:outer membrane lipase/esterase